MVRIVPLTLDNFHIDSLDSYVRRQTIQEIWRQVDGVWQLVPHSFVDDWDPGKRSKVAAEVLDGLRSGELAYGAFDGDALAGFALLSLKRFGSCEQYVQLKLLQISAPYRGKGIGRRLFELCANAARACGAKKLYISAHPSKESQAAYRRFGCTYASEVDEALAAAEPFDVQMEFTL